MVKRGGVTPKNTKSYLFKYLESTCSLLDDFRDVKRGWLLVYILSFSVFSIILLLQKGVTASVFFIKIAVFSFLFLLIFFVVSRVKGASKRDIEHTIEKVERADEELSCVIAECQETDRIFEKVMGVRARKHLRVLENEEGE